jgi:hypothetical protein
VGSRDRTSTPGSAARVAPAPRPERSAARAGAVATGAGRGAVAADDAADDMVVVMDDAGNVLYTLTAAEAARMNPDDVASSAVVDEDNLPDAVRAALADAERGVQPEQDVVEMTEEEYEAAVARGELPGPGAGDAVQVLYRDADEQAAL